MEKCLRWKLNWSLKKGKIKTKTLTKKGSSQETFPERAKGSPQETKRSFPGSCKQEVKYQDPHEEAEGPTERDQVESGSTTGQDLDRRDSQREPRRLTNSLTRLHGREVACRTNGRLQDVMVPVGALDDPARRRYFKNMAEQSWRRRCFLERREEMERGGGFKRWPHGDAAEPGDGSIWGSQEGGSSSSAVRRASAAGPVHLASTDPRLARFVEWATSSR